jgi:diguanylate cyclase (GGDEF)-like protein
VPWFSPLPRRALVILFVLVGLLPLAALTSVAMSLATDAVTRETNEHLSLSASVSAVYVGQQLESLEAVTQSFAHRPEMLNAAGDGTAASMDLGAIQPILDQLGTISPGVAGALMVDGAGIVVAASPARHPAAVGQDVYFTEWYHAVSQGRAAYVSSVYTSGVIGAPEVVAIAVPVQRAAEGVTTGPLLGILVLEYASDSIEHYTERIAAAQSVVVTVIDQYATIVARPASVGPPDPAVIRAALRGLPGLTRAGVTEPQLVAYAPIPATGWAVSAEISVAAAYADVQRLRITVPLLGAALALILLAGGWTLNRVLGRWQVAEEAVRRLAATDSLTGIWNRRGWDALLARELARASRERRQLAVAIFDVDNFKAFNDQHGHPAGDRLLVRAAESWLSMLRATDVLARYGGEEFAVAFADCTQPQAVAVVERLRAATPEGQTCSAGVAVWNGTESAAELLARADRALYVAKRAGRDQVVTAEPAADAA